MNRIYCKFVEKALVPYEAIDKAYFANGGVDNTFLTDDNIRCKVTFASLYLNQGGRFNEEFNEFCLRNFKMDFSSYRSRWIAKLHFVEDFWYVVKLEKI